MTFEESLGVLRDPGDEGVPDTIYDDLSGFYNQVVESGASALTEQAAEHDAVQAAAQAANDAKQAELNAEIARLKALNFDLLMAAGTESTENTDTPTDSTDTPSIESLFD